MIALSLLTVSCKNEVKQAEEEKESHEENVVELTEQQLNTIGVKFGHVEQRQLSGTINATGTLRLSPQDRADVTSLVAGITKRILVKEGQAVRKGQTLALDSGSAERLSRRFTTIIAGTAGFAASAGHSCPRCWCW